MELTHTGDGPSTQCFVSVLPSDPASSLTTGCTPGDFIATAEQPASAPATEHNGAIGDSETSSTLGAIARGGVILYRDGEFGAFAPGGVFCGTSRSVDRAQRLIDAAKGGAR